MQKYSSFEKNVYFGGILRPSCPFLVMSVLLSHGPMATLLHLPELQKWLLVEPTTFVMASKLPTY